MAKEIIITIGLPSSGKSTWANKFVNGRKNWIHISNDSIRDGFFCRIFSKQDTKNVNIIRELMIEWAIKNDLSIVIDNTNLHPKHEENYRRIAEENGYKFSVKDFTNVPLEICILRDRKRTKKVGHYVILSMYNQFLKPKDKEDLIIDSVDLNRFKGSNDRITLKQDKALQKAIICDLDGTIAWIDHRDCYDASNCDEDDLNESVCNCVKAMQAQGYKVIFVSGRMDKYEEPTRKFLKEKACFNEEDYILYMRKSGDSRKDSIIKKEIFDNYIKNNFYVEFILDDRDQVIKIWREMGLQCFQVNYGDF